MADETELTFTLSPRQAYAVSRVIRTGWQTLRSEASRDPIGAEAACAAAREAGIPGTPDSFQDELDVIEEVGRMFQARMERYTVQQERAREDGPVYNETGPETA